MIDHRTTISSELSRRLVRQAPAERSTQVLAYERWPAAARAFFIAGGAIVSWTVLAYSLRMAF